MKDKKNIEHYNIKITSNMPSQQAIDDFNKELARLARKYVDGDGNVTYNRNIAQAG